MENTLSDLIALVKRLPEDAIADAIVEISNIKAVYEKAEKQNVPPCPFCEGTNIVRNGHKHEKQAYICRECGKSFVSTTGTTFFNSHSSETVWKQVIKDTVDGVALNKTAQNLEIDHKTAFNMRHKILDCLERNGMENPIILEGVSEADETYVLESEKGKKIPADYHRKSRKHGAIAQKRGLSDEYVCVCTGVSRTGDAIAKSVNRAMPTKDNIEEVFDDVVTPGTLILCDGAKVYNILAENRICSVANATDPNNGSGFYNINTVNSFHSFIKERLRNYRGVATKFMNRYNALFARVFRQPSLVVDDIYKLLGDMDKNYRTIAVTQSVGLLKI